MVYSKTYPGLVVGSSEYNAAKYEAYNKRHKAEISRRRKASRDKNPEKYRLERRKSYNCNRDKVLSDLRLRNRNFRKFIGEYKASRGCSVCGFSELPEALVFHHVDESTKLRDVSKMGQCSDELIEKEIAKCIILCENCHRELHAEIRGGIVKNNRKLSEYKNRMFSLRVRRLLGCSRCGYHGNGVAIDFHHVNNDKFKSVAYLCCGSREKLKAEMRKCILLCANCHKRETRRSHYGREI